jgi:ATP/maltotriose-dependent transcriptional regulator MalT
MQSRQLPEAAGAFRDAIEQTKTSGALHFELLARGGLALAQLASGQPEALAELEAALGRAQEINDYFTAAIFSQGAAEARLAQGDLDGAQARLDQALDYFRRNDMHPYLKRAEATLAKLHVRQGLESQGQVLT